MALCKTPTAKTVLSTVASVAASAMLIRTITNEFLPDELRHYYFSALRSLLHRFSSQFTIVIEEFRGFSSNKLFAAADIYLGTKVSSASERVKVGMSENDKNLTINMDKDNEIEDEFEGIRVKWCLRCMETKSSSNARGRGERTRDSSNSSLHSEERYYELSFHKKHKEEVLGSYLAYVLAKADAIEVVGKAIKLHTVKYGRWGSNVMNLDHPMTFKTLAMDAELKKTIMEDLDNFKNGKEFYKRTGKAWKRGYLLFGPPGTGKSSLIASIANYLNYDIYDLDLTDVDSNSNLRLLLLSMSSRSILVIEDIDCSIDLENRQVEDKSNKDSNKVTLSGLLNFIDGIWSSCGEERIFIFTTNHKERLDPALLRPGRMDLHIHLSYCTFSAFKQLAYNYLQIKDHHLFEPIDELLKEAKATPAEIAGELMTKNRFDSTIALQDLIAFLNKKIQGPQLDN